MGAIGVAHFLLIDFCNSAPHRQSLALWWLLRRQGIASDLRLGMRKDASRFEAHAWVEYLGRVLNDRNDVHRRFAPFDRAIVPVQVKSP